MTSLEIWTKCFITFCYIRWPSSFKSSSCLVKLAIIQSLHRLISSNQTLWEQNLPKTLDQLIFSKCSQNQLNISPISILDQLCFNFQSKQIFEQKWSLQFNVQACWWLQCSIDYNQVAWRNPFVSEICPIQSGNDDKTPNQLQPTWNKSKWVFWFNLDVEFAIWNWFDE